MRGLNLLFCLFVFGCDSANATDAGASDSGLSDAGSADDVEALDVLVPDAFGGIFECDETVTFVATTEPVTRLEWAGAFLLVGSAAALESRSIDLSVIDRQEVATVSLSANVGRVVVSDGSEAHLFAIDEGGALSASGRVDVSGRSVSALRESRLFTFRYPLAARINTIEARDIENLASPVSLGEISVEGTGPVDVQIDGDTAFALDVVESRLSVIDIANPEAMSVTNILDIGGIVDTSELVATSDGIFVGTADSLVHVNASGSAVVGNSDGGALVVQRGARLATASSSQIFIYRTGGAGVEAIAVYDAQNPPTALVWTEDELLVGSADGLRSRRCAIR